MLNREKEPVVVCYDQEIARLAKKEGFKDIFSAKDSSNLKSLHETILKAIEFFRSPARQLSHQNQAPGR
jgi:hypothetical protein